MTTVSTIIPTYNRAHFILEALDSVLAQSWPVDEIIIIDDGSTDETATVLRPFASRIKYIWQPNCGPGAARNHGIREARGEFIAFLDSDDIWVNDKMKIQMDFFNEHPHLDFIFGDMANFSMNDNNDSPEIKNQDIHKYFTDHATNIERILDCLIIENVIPTPTVVFRKVCIDQIGFFDENLTIAEDLDFWFKAAQKCRFGFINKVLSKRRKHDNNLINDWSRMNFSLLEVLMKLQKSPRELPLQTEKLLKDKIFRVNYDLASFYLKQKDFDKAYSHFSSNAPTTFTNYKWLLKLFLSFLLRNVSRLWFYK